MTPHPCLTFEALAKSVISCPNLHIMLFKSPSQGKESHAERHKEEMNEKYTGHGMVLNRDFITAVKRELAGKP